MSVQKEEFFFYIEASIKFYHRPIIDMPRKKFELRLRVRTRSRYE